LSAPHFSQSENRVFRSEHEKKGIEAHFAGGYRLPSEKVEKKKKAAGQT
jgi:hypothetical protein